MTPRSLTVTTLVLALLAGGAAPAFAGSGPWYGGEGQYEPSTTYDTDQYMQQEANQAPVEKIYFNGFIVNRGQGTNLEGGSIRTSFSTFAAMLGYWRDCNGDGYIGAKNAPTPYGNWNTGSYPRDVIGIDTSICPPGSAYNRYTFIDEFRWIGPNAAATNSEVNNQENCNPADWTTIARWCTRQWRDPADVDDYDAKVWADFNRPDERAARTGSFTPGYMHHNSSGTLEYVNWFTGVSDDVDAVLGDGTWANKPNFGHCDGKTSDEFRSGDSFLGVTGTCGLYPLWQVNRLENDSRSEDERAQPLVTVYDTENDDGGDSDSPCDDTKFGDVEMADVEPAVHSNPLMRGSLGGTRQNVEEGTGNRQFDGECGAPDPNNSGSGSAPNEGKRSVNARFNFAPDKRLQTGRSLGIEYVPADTIGSTGGPTAPPGPIGNGGLDYVLLSTSAGPRWLGSPSYVTTGVPGGALGPTFATFFADVSPKALTNGGASLAALPAGVQDAHTYGDLQCGGNFDDTVENNQPDEVYGWVCSSKEWMSDDDNAVQYFAGMSFDFRDVDCYDDTVMAGLEWNDIESPDGDTLRQSCEEWRVNTGPGLN